MNKRKEYYEHKLRKFIKNNNDNLEANDVEMLNEILLYLESLDKTKMDFEEYVKYVTIICEMILKLLEIVS